MFVDYILNGQGHGAVAERLAGVRFDPGLMRPFLNDRGQPCMTVNTGRFEIKEVDGEQVRVPVFENRTATELISMGLFSPVVNAATSLRKNEWEQIDRVVIKAARQRLRAWADLAAANTFGGFNAMGKSILEYQTMSDPGQAMVDMDGLSEGRNDSPRFQLEGTPLPITHSSFWLSQRQLMISRNDNTPLDLTMAEACGRRVAEMIEKTTIGVETGMTYGNAANYGRSPTVYGYTNFPPRITKKDMTIPNGTNGETILTEWLQLRELLYDANFFGPFMVYTSSDWDAYLDNLFSTSEPSAGTLRSRLLQIDGINGIRRLDYLNTPYTVIMVQMTPEVAQAINGMDITTVQWESQGGWRINFKVMAIQVPRLRADYYGNCGIAHGLATVEAATS